MLTVALVAAPAAAQERPRPAVDLAAGWIGFADDGIVNEAMIGAAARWYLLPRLGLGPEVVRIRGNRHTHLVVTGNVVFDLAPIAERPPAVTPFVVAGGGLYRTRESFPSGDFTSSEGAFTVGGGVRARVTNRVSAGVDVRAGWEPHIRVNAVVGVQLGR